MLLSLTLLLGACAGAIPPAEEGGPGGAAVEGSSERYAVSPQGVISDFQTGLEWLVGPDRDMDYARAVQWVAGCREAGGGWRMPTRHELKSLYRDGAGERNMAPDFKTSGWWVWAENRDAQTAWAFAFNHGCITWDARANARYGRAFAVRSPRR